jgi:hypothetical protein
MHLRWSYLWWRHGEAGKREVVTCVGAYCLEFRIQERFDFLWLAASFKTNCIQSGTVSVVDSMITVN